MTTESVVTTTTDTSLYEIVDTVQAWVDTIEGIEDPAEREACEVELREHMGALVRKVDAFAAYLLRCQAEQDLIDAEIERLSLRKRSWAMRAERLEKYGVMVLEQLPAPKRGPKKIEGSLHTLTLKAGSPRVEITDEAAVPSQYKTVTIAIPAGDWESHIEWLGSVSEFIKDDLLSSITKADCSVSKTELAKAIKAGEEVPGADLRWGGPSLKVS